MLRKKCVLLFTGILAFAIWGLTGCGSTPATSVAVSASATTVDGTDTATLTATVTNDKNSAGVTWTVSGGGALSNTTTSSATYTAPAATTSSQSVTVTATSIADPTKSGTATITIPAKPAISTTSTSLAWSVGTTSAVTLAGTGGISPYTWSWAAASGSTLPQCLALTSAGVLAGTPTAACAGTYSAVFTMTDSGTPTKLTATSTLTITVTAPTITFPAALASGAVGSAYSGSVAATGPVGTTTYSLASGALPASGDLVLNTSTGAISGTPKAADAGTYAFAVKVADAYGDTATSGTYSLKINAAPAITFGSAPTAIATAGTAYSSALAATGGAGALAYSITSGSLPTGMSLNASTGAITGTPTTVGASTFTAQAADSFGDTPATQSYTITVNPGAATHFTVAATSATSIAAGGSVSFTVTALDSNNNTATGYTGTAKFTSTDSQAELPTNSTLTNGTGSFSATLKTAGSQTVTATDTVTATITGSTPAITVAAGTATKLAVTAPSAATKNVAFNFTVTAQDNYGNTAASFANTVSFSSTDTTAVLPASSALTNGTGSFSATMKTEGSFTITAIDVSNASVSGTSGAITVSTALTVATTTMKTGNVGSSYTQTLTASGGSGSGYTWSTTSNLASYGLSLSTAGVVSGTPTQSGTVSFTAKVTDSSNNVATQSLPITIYSALSLPTPNPSSLPAGYTGIAYNGMIIGTGGSGNLTAAVSTALSPTNGTLTATASGGMVTISGSATDSTTETFGVTLTDSTTGNTVTQNGYSITFTAPAIPSLPAASSTVPGSTTTNANYTSTITATGGVGQTYVWTLNSSTTVPTSGTVAVGSDTLGSEFFITNPGGGSSVTITGTPTTNGLVTFTLAVKDVPTNMLSTPVTYTIAVNPAPTLLVLIENVPQGMVGMPYTFGELDVSGGTAPYTITYSNLPSGLSQSSTNSYQIVGTPTGSGTTTVTVHVTDNASGSVTKTFDLPVVAATTATHNSYLNGQYACYYQQYWDGGITGTKGTYYRGGTVLAFTANGSGTISGGEMDSNSPGSGYKHSSSLGGTYVIGADNRGYLNLTANSKTMLYALSGGSLDASSHFTDFAFVAMDDAGSSPSGKTGMGHCYQQVTTTALNTLTLSGGYVFGWRGEDESGKSTSMAGFVKFKSSDSTVSGVADMVDNGTYTGNVSLTGTYTSSMDSYGRTTMTAGPSGDNAMPFVVYITNNTAGQAVLMSTATHESTVDTSYPFYIGPGRAQVSAHVSASYPLSGNAVLYTSGLNDDLTAYKAQIVQATGSPSANTFTPHVNYSNNGGTLKTTDGSVGQTITYNTDTTTGRTTLSAGGSPLAGDVFYVYDTNSAVALFGDGGTKVQEQLGWMEPQVSSGSWAISQMSTAYFMSELPNNDYSSGSNTGVFSIDGSGNMTGFTQDQSGQNWADWDEGMSGSSGTSATGAVSLDSTYGMYGLIDINATVSGSTETVAYCMAVSVDKTTSSSTKGRLVCLDASGESPSLSIAQE